MTAPPPGADGDAPPPDIFELEALLAFQMESGVDWVLDEEPHDRFAEAGAPPSRYLPAWLAGGTPQDAAPPGPPRSSAPAGDGPGRNLGPRRPGPQLAPAPDAPRAIPAAAELAAAADDIAMQAGALARSARTLEELKAAMEQFDGCSLKRTARQLVFADGAPDARIMLVGEAPGADEDRIGRPFVGRSGQLLDRMLAAIGLDRSKVFIANTVPWRPPGNRTPTPQESAICRPFIERQIELVNPDVLVCLGGPAAQALLGVREGVLRIRGRWQSYVTGDRQIHAMATLHPAYLLRSPLQKRLAWRDLRAIRAVLDGAAPGS